MVSLQYLQYSHDLKMKTQKSNAVRCAQTAEMRIADELLCFPLVSMFSSLGKKTLNSNKEEVIMFSTVNIQGRMQRCLSM